MPPRQSSSSDCSAHTCPALGLVHPAVVAPPRVCLTKVPRGFAISEHFPGSLTNPGGPHVMGAVRLTDCRRSAHADRGCPRCRCPVFPSTGPWHRSSMDTSIPSPCPAIGRSDAVSVLSRSGNRIRRYDRSRTCSEARGSSVGSGRWPQARWCILTFDVFGTRTSVVVRGGALPISTDHAKAERRAPRSSVRQPARSSNRGM